VSPEEAKPSKPKSHCSHEYLSQPPSRNSALAASTAQVSIPVSLQEIPTRIFSPLQLPLLLWMMTSFLTTMMTITQPRPICISQPTWLRARTSPNPEPHCNEEYSIDYRSELAAVIAACKWLQQQMAIANQTN